MASSGSTRRFALWDRAWQVLLFAMPPLVALILVGAIVAPFKAEQRLEAVWAVSAEALQALFAQRDFHWPPRQGVPRLGVRQLPGGLAQLEVERKKSLFFRALLPIVLAENERIAQQRQLLVSAFGGPPLRPGTKRYRRVTSLARGYGVAGDLNQPANRERLLRRVDVVPAALVLAQAANESAWGTSRFALAGNNLFGHWTYEAEQGMLPRERAEGASHFVRVFSDVQSSVRAYLHNINVGHAYRELRAMRAAMRAAGEPLDAIALSNGLLRYSERGQAYVRDIQALIRHNRLQQLNGLSLVERQ